MTIKQSKRKIEYMTVERDSAQYATDVSTEVRINHVSEN